MKVFDGASAPEEFIEDLKVLVSLAGMESAAFVEWAKQVENIWDLSEEESLSLTTKILPQRTSRELNSVLKVVRHILREAGRLPLDGSDIRADLEEAGLSLDECDAAEAAVIPLIDSAGSILVRYLETVWVSSLAPTLEEMQAAIDIRTDFVDYPKNEYLEVKGDAPRISIPMVLLKLRSSDSPRPAFIVQLTEKGLDDLIAFLHDVETRLRASTQR